MGHHRSQGLVRSGGPRGGASLPLPGSGGPRRPRASASVYLHVASLCLCVSCFVCTKGSVTGFRATCSRRTHQVPQKSRCTHPVFTQSHSHRSWALGLRNTFILGKVSAPFHVRQEQGELQSFLGVGDEENQGDVIFPLLPRVPCPRTVIKGGKKGRLKREMNRRGGVFYTQMRGRPTQMRGRP